MACSMLAIANIEQAICDGVLVDHQRWLAQCWLLPALSKPFLTEYSETVRLADRRHPGRKLPRDQRARSLTFQRSGEQISLAVLTLENLEILALLGGLDPFGDHLHPQTTGERNDSTDDRQVLLIDVQPGDEGAIDLQHV